MVTPILEVMEDSRSPHIMIAKEDSAEATEESNLTTTSAMVEAAEAVEESSNPGGLLMRCSAVLGNEFNLTLMA